MNRRQAIASLAGASLPSQSSLHWRGHSLQSGSTASGSIAIVRNGEGLARGERGINQLLPKVHAHTFQMNAMGLLGRFYKMADLTVSPFANLGRWYADPNARPDIKQKPYSYSVWLPS